jgi:hypothetical protein
MNFHETSRITHLLKTNVYVKIREILMVLLVAIIIIATFLPWAGENQIKIQGVVWVAKLKILLLVWLGVKLRGDTWDMILLWY